MDEGKLVFSRQKNIFLIIACFSGKRGHAEKTKQAKLAFWMVEEKREEEQSMISFQL